MSLVKDCYLEKYTGCLKQTLDKDFYLGKYTGCLKQTLGFVDTFDAVFKCRP